MQDRGKIKTKLVLTSIVIIISLPLMGQLNLMPTVSGNLVVHQLFFSIDKYPLLQIKSNSILPNSSYTSPSWIQPWKSEDLPVFCKAEHLIQKRSGMAFRFRLGSLDYVDALEGK